MPSINKTPSSERYDWKLYRDAEQFLQKQISDFLVNSEFSNYLAENIERATSSRFFDWIDHMVLPIRKIKYKTLERYGFKVTTDLETRSDSILLQIKGSTFFPLILHEKDETELALKPESLNDFCSLHARRNKIQGEEFSPYRRMEVELEEGFLLTAVERRGYAGFAIKKPTDVREYSKAMRLFSSRERVFDTDKEGLESIENQIKEMLNSLHKSRIADAFFRAEREYWTSRNSIGRVQKERQDKLGLGWGNHDHHAFRSSRRNFPKLIRIFESMGFVPREAFYAGKQAGWGAQILEQSDCSLVVFSDVDLGIEERGIDFAHTVLKPQINLGTIGLWVGLHGESILQGGMHHLAARYAFETLNENLAELNLKLMAPFSHFDFLKQAFSQGEYWRVDEKRAKNLLKKNLISEKQFTKFMSDLAIGSHLENIERRRGFKGFNQDSVSVIIKATDPRKQRHRAA